MARYNKSSESPLSTSGGVTAASSHSQSIVLKRPQTSCRECCLFVLVVIVVIFGVLLFLVIGPMLCFLRMKRFTRVIILWFWLTLASIVVGMVLAFDVYIPVVTNVAGREQRIFTDALSTIMCEGVEVRSPDSVQTTSYLLPDIPEIGGQEIFYRFNRQDNVSPRSFVQYPFYLLGGSSVKYFVNTTSPVTFFLIKGRYNFTYWQGNYICNRGYCFSDIRTIENDLEYSVSISTTDMYYFAFAKTKFNDERPADVEIEFRVRRTVYNVTSALDVCSNRTCHFDYNFNTRQVLLIQIPDLKGNQNFEEVETKCIARNLVYIVSFCVGPFAFGIIVSLVLVLCCKKCETSDEGDIVGIKSGLRAAGDMARRYSSIAYPGANRSGDGAHLNRNSHINDDHENSWPA